MGPCLAAGMGPAFGSGGSFLGTAASTAAGVIGGGLLLNSIRSMFGDHAGLGGHERSALGSSSGSTADSALAQKDRDQDQDQDQDDQEQEDQELGPGPGRPGAGRPGTRTRTRTRMMPAVILAGTIPTTREFFLRGQNLGPNRSQPRSAPAGAIVQRQKWSREA